MAKAPDEDRKPWWSSWTLTVAAVAGASVLVYLGYWIWYLLH